MLPTFRRFREIFRGAEPEALIASDPPPPIAEPPAAAAVPATPSTPSASRPRMLVVLDVENLWSCIRAAGCRFDPSRISECIRGIGEPVLAFAVGNLEAIPPKYRELLTLAGYDLLHCERLRNGTEGRKDVVDSHIYTLVWRILSNAPSITTVVLGTVDQDFAALVTTVRDLGRRCVILTPRHGSALSRIADETVHLPIAVDTAHAPDEWCPDVAITALRAAARAGAGTTSAQQALVRLRILAPLPVRILVSFLRKYRRRFGAGLVGRGKLLACLQTSAHPDDRSALTDGALEEFLDALITADIIATRTVQLTDGPSERFTPDWWNPFCRDAVADLIASEAQERTDDTTASTPQLEVVA